MASPKSRSLKAILGGPLRDPPSLRGHAAHTPPMCWEHEAKESSPVVWILPCCKGLLWLVLYAGYLSSDLSCTVSTSLCGKLIAFILNVFEHGRSSPFFFFLAY